jgi:molybdopterin/thiamine biosynthesis adenylyltransferase
MSPTRYARQAQFAPIGAEGQARISAARVLLCGCGALGTVIASTLARAGVGCLRIVDRDFVELNNLQRQVLFDEADVASGLPKAICAAEKLRAINSEIEIEPIVADITSTTLPPLLEGVDLILDGLDNFETRFLINDAAIKHNIPWVFGGCLGAEGQSMTIVPGQTPCYRCLLPEPPDAGAAITCDMAGILGPIINLIASVQCTEALKILTGATGAIRQSLLLIDLWTNYYREMSLASLAPDQCPCCGKRDFPWLEGRRANPPVVLCGRNAVQISPPQPQKWTPEEVRERLAPYGTPNAPVKANKFLAKAQVGEFEVTLFLDGRAIIQGTQDPAAARSIYAKCVGV